MLLKIQKACGCKIEEKILTCSVQRRGLCGILVGAEEEPDQQPCQSHDQRCQVHLGCFEGVRGREEGGGGLRVRERQKEQTVDL